MSFAKFREKMLSGAPLAGTFLKTPSIEIIEVLAKSGLEFLCLDVEHAPFDRARMDGCMAIARALDFPMLVRVGDSSPREILQALDAGAVGIVVPHVDSVEKAQAVAKAARYGHGGRGYAGSTRWAGFATRPMPDILEQSRNETVVIAQIEEPEGVDVASGIAAVEGIDALFLGPADLSVAYGYEHQNSDELMAAFESVGQACKAAGKAYVTFVADAAKAKELQKYGLSVFFVASEHSWMLNGARTVAQGVHDL
jgi:2-keto-3-deoxy-L-rhamnonate aldolase RhmA